MRAPSVTPAPVKSCRSTSMRCCAALRRLSLHFTWSWVSAWTAFDLGTNLGLHNAVKPPNGCYITVMCCPLTGDGELAALYDQAAALRLEAIESALWDAERGAWFDYNLVTHSKHSEFYPSNLAPLWAQCYSQPAMGEKAVQYLKVGGHCSLEVRITLSS